MIHEVDDVVITVRNNDVPVNHFDRLPKHVLWQIFDQLGESALRRAENVSRAWRVLSLSSPLATSRYLGRLQSRLRARDGLGDEYDMLSAVAWSAGGLVLTLIAMLPVIALSARADRMAYQEFKGLLEAFRGQNHLFPETLLEKSEEIYFLFGRQLADCYGNLTGMQYFPLVNLTSPDLEGMENVLFTSQSHNGKVFPGEFIPFGSSTFSMFTLFVLGLYAHMGVRAVYSRIAQKDISSFDPRIYDLFAKSNREIEKSVAADLKVARRVAPKDEIEFLEQVEEALKKRGGPLRGALPKILTLIALAGTTYGLVRWISLYYEKEHLGGYPEEPFAPVMPFSGRKMVKCVTAMVTDATDPLTHVVRNISYPPEFGGYVSKHADPSPAWNVWATANRITLNFSAWLGYAGVVSSVLWNSAVSLKRRLTH